jgi:hypothetical protein
MALISQKISKSMAKALKAFALWANTDFKIVHLHIQLCHVSDSNWDLLAAATTLITVLKILLTQTFS